MAGVDTPPPLKADLELALMSQAALVAYLNTLRVFIYRQGKRAAVADIRPFDEAYRERAAYCDHSAAPPDNVPRCWVCGRTRLAGRTAKQVLFDELAFG
jgi:hypothetical protein